MRGVRHGENEHLDKQRAREKGALKFACTVRAIVEKARVQAHPQGRCAAPVRRRGECAAAERDDA